MSDPQTWVIADKHWCNTPCKRCGVMQPELHISKVCDDCRAKFTRLEGVYAVHYKNAGAEPYDHKAYEGSQEQLDAMIKTVYGEPMAELAAEFILDSSEVPSVEDVREHYLDLWRSELFEAALFACHAQGDDDVKKYWDRIRNALAHVALVDTEMDRQAVLDKALAQAMKEKAADYGIDIPGWAWTCPACSAYKPEITESKTPGFTGAPIYLSTFECCGHVVGDASEDNAEAAR